MDPFLDSLPRLQQSLAALLILTLAGIPVLVMVAGAVSLLFPSVTAYATGFVYLCAVLPSALFYFGVKAISRVAQ